MTLDMVYLDNHLFVVHKPAGLLAQADETGDLDLLTLGKAYIKDRFDKSGEVYLGLVHRLDRPVSGLMVLARTSKAAGRLSEQFRQKTPDKRYVALVEGRLTGAGTYTDYIAKRGRRPQIVEAVEPKARYAELSWRAVAFRRGWTLVDVGLKTGRPHQIRLQLAHHGTPILGDLRYKARGELDGRNLALHCYHLGLEHPVLRQWMQWVAFPPSTWPTLFDPEIRQLVQRP